MNDVPVSILPEIADAQSNNLPVVAFETTILSFGLPVPLNLEVGSDCEKAARQTGSVPATLGILDGKIRVGLSPAEIERFCKPDSGIRKVNLQNLTAVLAGNQCGALTVAASLQVCVLAGIPVFATGGIGGVHRGFINTHDVSSDLVALSRYPVVTVCAGAKSILDVPATLEALETLGVPVVGFETDTFPLFHARDSNYMLDITFSDIRKLCRYLRMHRAISNCAVLVVTPVPQDHAIPSADLEHWITEALKLADEKGITGKKVTPFLLQEIEKLSAGRTLKANAALIRNNAELAARIAVELTK